MDEELKSIIRRACIYAVEIEDIDIFYYIYMNLLSSGKENSMGWNLSKKFKDELKEAINQMIDDDNFDHLNLQKIACTSDLLSENFIAKIIGDSEIPEYYYTNYQLSENFIRFYSNKIKDAKIWRNIASFQKLSIDFIKQYLNCLPKDSILNNRYLSAKDKSIVVELYKTYDDLIV
jgi:hypothetical protein